MASRIQVFRGVVLMVVAVTINLWSLGTSADVAATYKTKCAMCHGADGKGETPVGKKMGAHDFASPEVQKMTDAELTTVTAKGKAKMPAYEKKLSDAEIKELVTYIRQLAKSK